MLMSHFFLHFHSVLAIDSVTLSFLIAPSPPYKTSVSCFLSCAASFHLLRTTFLLHMRFELSAQKVPQSLHSSCFSWSVNLVFLYGFHCYLSEIFFFTLQAFYPFLCNENRNIWEMRNYITLKFSCFCL